jgi:hypothetical protein
MTQLNTKRERGLVSYLSWRHIPTNSDGKTGPSCRTAVSAEKMFSRQAFEPTDADLDPTVVKPEDGDDTDIPDISDVFEDAIKVSKGKGKAKKRARRIVDSEDDSEGGLDSEMEDFIVHSDEDEAEKDARRAEKRLGKKRVIAKIESDDEMESGDDREVIYGKKARVSILKEQVELLPRFLPSTKMKVNEFYLALLSHKLICAC